MESLLLGFSVALQPDVLWYAFLGCLVGTIVGVLPGIGPLSGISILLPATFGLDTTKSIVMLAGIYYGSQYGGSTTSILMRIPGEASSVMTCIDGYAMARKGRAGAALCIAAVGSWIAGTFGVLMLTLIAPPLATFSLRFGPPEYSALLVLGFLIGLTPGSAHIISSFLSYAVERRLSKNPAEFGKGAVAGVAGPESANNAASTGAFVPMLALGLPTGPITAVLIAALMIHGVPPGPTLVNEHPNIFWGFVASMYVGNLMLLALNLPLVGIFVNILRIPYAYLYPLVIMFCIIGVYEVSHSIVDVWIMLIMGVIGYGLRKLGLDPAPLVLGLVISPTLEMSLRQSLIMSNGNWTIFFQRPIAAVLLSMCAVLLALAALSLRRSRADWRSRLAEVEAAENN